MIYLLFLQIIYDNDSQEGQVVKLITNIKSEDDVSDQNPDPDNVITLHASSNDSKDETIENVVAVPTQVNPFIFKFDSATLLNRILTHRFLLQIFNDWNSLLGNNKDRTSF